MATDISNSVEELLRDVSNLKSTVADAVQEGVRSAMDAAKQGRQTAEDVIEQSRRAARQNPLQTIGVAFAAGVVVGCVVAWLGFSGD